MKSVFHNKDGSLTRYSLACGYIEKEYHFYSEGRAETKLYLEHDVYNVLSYDYDNHKRLHWEQFTRLKDARRFYRKLVNYKP